MIKGYKYRIYPTSEQAQLIDKIIGTCRFVYNLALETKIRAYKDAGISLSVYDLQKQFTDLRRSCDWIREIAYESPAEVIKQIDSAYKSFFNGGGYPKFKSRRNGGSMIVRTYGKIIDFENGLITAGIVKNVKAKLSKRFDGSIIRMIVSKTATGKYFVSAWVKEDNNIVPKKEITAETTIGIDAGIKSFVATSDGRMFEPNRKLKNNLKRLKCLQRRASRKKKGSNNRKKANLCVAILHEKITNQRTGYIHKVTTGLIRDNQAETFVIENLNVAGMLKNRKLSQALSDVSFGELFRQLKYKCEWYGKNLIVIDRFEPTSKMCSDCGVINQALTLADREWICANCGSLHERDFNAAKNIRNAGLKKHSGAGSPGGSVELLLKGKAKKQKTMPNNIEGY